MMNAHGIKRLAGLLLLAGLLVFLAAGCTKYASEEDLATLNDKRQAAEQAQEQLREEKQDTEELRQDLSAKKAELEEVRAEKDVVAERLAAWEEANQGMSNGEEGQ